MRINELILENTKQLDELSLAGVGKGIGNAIRGTSSAVQGAKGAWQGAKDAWSQGKQSGTYNAARTAVSGVAPPAPNTSSITPPTTPATQTTPPATQTTPTTSSITSPQQAAQQTAQAKIGVGQINKIIPTLRTRDLTSVKKIVDSTLAQKQKAPTTTPASTTPTQAEIDADHARLASGTNESVAYSRFLGMPI